jgi:putative tryptophan/tyrosine transport system substrate-binding protein
MNCLKSNSRKIISVMLAVLACFALAIAMWGCSSNNSNNGSSSQQTEGSKDRAIKVCFVEIVDNDAFATMIDGFKTGMKDAGYTNVTYDTKNAQGDSSTLNQIAAQLKNSNYDVIVPIATPPAQACANAGISKPMVFMSVTDPVNAGITSSLEKPDKGMTGTTNFADVEAIFKAAEELKSDVLSKKVGIIYCSSDKNAQVTAEQAQDYLKERGVESEIKTVTNSSEVQQAGQALASECGSIYVPADSIVQVAMAQLTEVATKAGIPVLGTDPVMTENGALESVSCTNDNLGQESGKLADALLSGKSVSEVPVSVLPSSDKSVCKATADALGITIPTDKNFRII